MSLLLVLGYPFETLAPGESPRPIDWPPNDPLMVVNDALRAAGIPGYLDPTDADEEDAEEDEDDDDGDGEDYDESDDDDGEDDEFDEDDGEDDDEDEDDDDEVEADDDGDDEDDEEDGEDGEEDGDAEDFWNAEIGYDALEALVERVVALSEGDRPAIAPELAEHLMGGIDGCWVPADFSEVVVAQRTKMRGYEDGEDPDFPVCSLVRMKEACEALLRALGFDGDPDELPLEEESLSLFDDWAPGGPNAVSPLDFAILITALSFHQGARVALEAECELAFG